MSCVVIDHSFSWPNRTPLGAYVTIYLLIFMLDGHTGRFQILSVTDRAAVSLPVL